MQFLKRKEYPICLGDLTAVLKCPTQKENLEFDLHITSPNIELSYDISSFRLRLSEANTENLYHVNTSLVDDKIIVYLSDSAGPVTSIYRDKGIAILGSISQRINKNFDKTRKTMLKKARNLLKSWQTGMLVTKDTSKLLYSTLEEIIDFPEILYLPRIEKAELNDNKSTMPIISYKLLQIGNAIEEYISETPQKYLLSNNNPLFNRPMPLLILASVHNLINPNSGLYSEMDDMEAVEKSLNNFSKLCEYYLPGFSKENVNSIHDEISFNPIMHRMVSGFLATKAISKGYKKYNSISIKPWKTFALIGLPWALAYIADTSYDLSSMVYALPFATNLALAKIGIANPIHYNEAVYHTNHSFNPLEEYVKHEFSRMPETQLMGLARLGAATFR